MVGNSRIMSFATAAYGYFEAFDGQLFVDDEWTPPDDFVIEERPWYLAAVKADGDVGVTDPYFNRIQDTIVLTFARRIFDDEGRPMGIICLDMSLERIKVYAVEAYVTDNGYGILTDGNFNVLAHPHPAYLGKSLLDMNDGPAIEKALRQGHNIVEREATDYRGDSCILFINKLDNGWYLGILTYSKQYYAMMTRMAQILITLGSVFALIVSFILIRMIMEKYKSDERMQVMFDAMPLNASYWNRNCENIDCNQEVIRLFNVSSKQEYLEKFYDLSPVYQPNGYPSKLLVHEHVKKAYEEGYNHFEWMHQTINGEPLPCDVTLVRLEHRGGYIVAGYTRDLREHKALINEINNKK
jgi:PAS domain-containing protein